MRAPIVSRKHIVQHTQNVVASSAVTTNVPIRGVAVQDVSAAFELIEGSVVKAVYVERWICGDQANITSFVLIVEKVPAGAAPPTFTQMTTLDAYPNKKNILYTTMGIVSNDTANPTPVLRNWIKIPKGKQRFGLEDELRISVAGIGAEALVQCGLVIYKSYL